MKTAESVLLTEEGWRDLREELVLLHRQRRSRTAECADIAQSAEWGEITSEYLQSGIASLDRRIAWLEDALSRAVPVRPSDREPGAVGVGSHVIVRWEDGGEESYAIVGSPEVDVPRGRISYESPIGQALVGRRKGESAVVASPNGLSRLELLAVE